MHCSPSLRRRLAALAFLLTPALVAACSCRSSEEPQGADPPVPAVAPPDEATLPTRGICAKRRRCCAALGAHPGLEGAKPLCKMQSFSDAMGSDIPIKSKALTDVCRLQLVQLQQIWNLHTMTDAGTSAPLPEECGPAL